jgi:transcriptional regulator NrdR family protein
VDTNLADDLSVMGLNMTGAPCPNCGTLITKVVHTSKDQSQTRFIRRRHCQTCDHRFYTAQSVETPVEFVGWVKVRGKSIPVVEQ